MTDRFEGGCLCGRVRFRTTAPSLWCGHCHCSLCRRAHGAAFVTWVGIANERFEITQGASDLRWHRSTERGERGFCTACGSTLFFRGESWPGETHVVRSNFDAEIDLKPQGHGYWETHVPWVTLSDQLPRKTS